MHGLTGGETKKLIAVKLAVRKLLLRVTNETLLNGPHTKR